jgi:surface antigen
MSGRARGRRSAPAIAGLTLLLGACAQAPAPAELRSDPAYGSLTTDAAVLARMTVQEALETARSRTSLSWADAEGGSKGEITPLRTYRSTTGYYCREYVEIVETSADGRSSRQRTACRDSDGLWKLVQS